MFKRIYTDLPYDRDVRLVYDMETNVLCTNVSADPNAKVIVLWDAERYEALKRNAKRRRWIK